MSGAVCGGMGVETCAVHRSTISTRSVTMQQLSPLMMAAVARLPTTLPSLWCVVHQSRCCCCRVRAHALLDCRGLVSKVCLFESPAIARAGDFKKTHRKRAQFLGTDVPTKSSTLCGCWNWRPILRPVFRTRLWDRLRGAQLLIHLARCI
jgi:hypothetical protein